MTNDILYEFSDLRLPPKVQLRRLQRVMETELTCLQKEVIEAIYFRELSQAQFAQERGVSRSTVCRTLHRAEQRLRRFLRY